MATHFQQLRYCRNFLCFSLLVLGTTVCWSQNTRAQDSPAKSFLLLEHGGILHGVTQPVGDQIAVHIEKGNTIQVKKNSVIHIAKTKVELYEYQVKSIRRWGPNEHRHITQWCIQNELIEQALYHFKQLSHLVEPSPNLRQLEHQIKVAILESEPVQKYLAEQQRALGISTNSNATFAISEQPTTYSDYSDSENAVQTASANIPRSTFVDDGNSTQSAADEIRVNQLPSYVRKTFQQTITPILVQRCGQSGCHGLPGKSDFHIYQPLGEQAYQTAISNLVNVLRYVDVKRPNESPLLAYATNAHGIQKHPTLNALKEADQTAIARIEQWIKSIDSNQATYTTYPVVPSVAIAGAPPDPLGIEKTWSPTKPNLLETPLDEPAAIGASALSRKEMLLNLRNNLGEQDPDAKLSKPPKSGALPAIIDAAEIASLERAIERLEKSESTNEKKDPFDPNEFNSRFGPKK